MSTVTASDQGLAGCETCFALASAEDERCSTCGARLHGRVPHSIQRCVALCATAVLLYVPANALPIMSTDQLGRVTDRTILGGVIELVEYGSYPIAAVIFAASVLVPVGKLFALGWLCWSVRFRHVRSRAERTTLYRLTELVGKWSMTDVFVVAVLVALIHLGGVLNITPGPAALAFGAMVIATMLAAESFDPRLIWDEPESDRG
jgi:paraquat-inducible protein A